MHEGWVARINLEGKDGNAEIDVRVSMSVAEAREHAHLMLATGTPIRVLFRRKDEPTGGKDE